MVILSWVCNKSTQLAAPSLLDNSMGRVLHRYCRCQGFKSHTSMFFYFRLSFCNCVYNCNDHLSFNAQKLWFYNYQILRFLTQTNGQCQTNLVLRRFTVSSAKWEYFWIACISIVAVLNGNYVTFSWEPKHGLPYKSDGDAPRKIKIIPLTETNLAVAQA